MILKRRQSLSVVMIVKNEAELLPEALASVQWADEIIVLIDCDSIDSSDHIARKYGAKVYYSKKWIGFGKQRQHAQNFAISDMILMLDADERVTKELCLEIKNILNQPAQLNIIYSIVRRNFFLGRFMKYSGWYPDRVIRLYPNCFHYNNNMVHESLNIKQACITKLSGELYHLTCRDLITFQQKQLSYAHAWAKEQFKYKKKCTIFSIFYHSLSSFLKTLILRRSFLDGKQGWILAVVHAQYTFNKYSLLWELHHIPK